MRRRTMAKQKGPLFWIERNDTSGSYIGDEVNRIRLAPGVEASDMRFKMLDENLSEISPESFKLPEYPDSIWWSLYPYTSPTKSRSVDVIIQHQAAIVLNYYESDQGPGRVTIRRTYYLHVYHVKQPSVLAVFKIYDGDGAINVELTNTI